MSGEAYGLLFSTTLSNPSDPHQAVGAYVLPRTAL